MCQMLAADPSNATLMAGCFATGEVGGLPYLPCMVSAPQACFREYAEEMDALHPSYKVIDPFIKNVPNLAAQLPVPWTGPAGRPSYRNLTAQDMKEEVSKVRPLTGERGCNGWSEQITFGAGTWGGGVKRNEDGNIEKVQAIMWTLFIDAPARVAFRMGCSSFLPSGLCSSSGTPEGAEVAEAIDLLQSAWQREVEAFSAQSKLLEVVNMQYPTTFEEIANQYEDIPYGMITLGYILMCLFIV
jgi:hypothetical protein